MDDAKPAGKAANPAERQIDYSSFGDLSSSTQKTVSRKPVVVPVEFALQSILMTGADGVAVVNGNLVRQGDQVGGGYRVVKVEPEAVWLAIKRTTSVKVGKKIRQQSKDELKVLHFPELRDGDMDATKLAGNSGAQAPVAPEQRAGQIELEKNYKQILEMLKL